MAGLSVCSDDFRPRCPEGNRRLTVGRWHLPKWGCRAILAGWVLQEFSGNQSSVARPACGCRPAKNYGLAYYLNGLRTMRGCRAGRRRGWRPCTGAAHGSHARQLRATCAVGVSHGNVRALLNEPARKIVGTRGERRRSPPARPAARLHISGSECRLKVREMLIGEHPVEVLRQPSLFLSALRPPAVTGKHVMRRISECFAELHTRER